MRIIGQNIGSVDTWRVPVNILKGETVIICVAVLIPDSYLDITVFGYRYAVLRCPGPAAVIGEAVIRQSDSVYVIGSSVIGYEGHCHILIGPVAGIKDMGYIGLVIVYIRNG